MESEKMREEFEARYPLAPGCVFHEGKYGFWIVWDESGEPEFSTGMGLTQMKWEAWQASRESLVIDLDRCAAEVYDGSGNLDFTATVNAIEAAGLKVKP